MKSDRLLKHALIWGLFITYEITYIKFAVGVQSDLIHYIVFYGLNIALFYVNASGLDYAFFRTNTPYLCALVLIPFALAGYLCLKAAADHFLQPSAGLLSDRKYVLTNLWRGIYFVGFSIAYWSFRYMLYYKERYYLTERRQLQTLAENLELENKYISATNAYLQLQVSPHVMFNSLNFIYSSVQASSPEAGKGVLLLAELMRYTLAGATDSRTVLLSEEVRQVETLIDLCRLRFGGSLYLRLKKKGKLSAARILPLILITLVENMMKHGDLGEKKAPAMVIAELNDNRLHFETVNQKRPTSLYPKTGLGLQNLEKRLDNFYSGRFTLQIEEGRDLFHVTLTIDL